MPAEFYMNYDSIKTKRSLDMLLVDRSNEFIELANAIGYSTSFNNWKEFILRFCLEFNDCFNMWTEKEDHGNHNKIHKCMTVMRQIANGKSNITQVSKLQNIAYKIAKDFNTIYYRIN